MGFSPIEISWAKHATAVRAALLIAGLPRIAAGSPKSDDMIARNPANHAEQWLVAAAYFAANFEAVDAASSLTAPEPEAHNRTRDAGNE
jgi:hypothetical protein